MIFGLVERTRILSRQLLRSCDWNGVILDTETGRDLRLIEAATFLRSAQIDYVLDTCGAQAPMSPASIAPLAMRFACGCLRLSSCGSTRSSAAIVACTEPNRSRRLTAIEVFTF